MDLCQEDVYESLFLKSAVPTSIAGKKITNKLCREILQKYRDTYSVYFNEKEVSVMRRIFTLIDAKINFPVDDKFKNFKRKALKLDDQNDGEQKPVNTVVDSKKSEPQTIIMDDRNVRMFHDDTFPSFYRRLDFSPDGM